MRRITVFCFLLLPALAGEPDAAVLELYDVRDLDAALALARVRAVVGEDGDVLTKGSVVVVRAPGEVQRRVRAELTSLRRVLGRTVTMDVRYVRFRKSPGTTTVPATALDAFLAEHAAKVLASPRLTCRNGQRASITVENEVAFVADFDVEVAQGQVIADPVVATVREGLTVNARAVVDEKTVLLALEARLSRLDRPIPTLKLPHGGTIQVPAGRSRGVVRLLRCEPDTAVVVDLGEDEALIVTARASG